MPEKSNRNAEQAWVPARLIPTAGIRGEAEQENRATSALLAVLAAVPAFSRAFLKTMGAPRGRVKTFTEVRFKGPDGTTDIPDGVIAVEHGSTRWTCLVEVKTAAAELGSGQVTRYLDIARRQGFDGVLTISSQIVADPDALPYKLNGSKIGKLTVRHLSWWQVLTEAVVQHRFRGVDDPDQAWILNELIRYLTDERSGAGGFEGMGRDWVGVRDGARNGTLRASDPAAAAVAVRWEELIEYLCLNLSQELGVIVRRQRPRGKSPEDRLKGAVKRLVSEGTLHSAIRVPEAIGPIEIEADLRSGQLTTSVGIDAPRDRKRPTARINWLLRQLRDAPDSLRIDVRFAHLREGSSALLADCRDDPGNLLLPNDPKREPRSFALASTRALGRKNGRVSGSFAAETCEQAMSFYRELVQNLRPPHPKAPQLADEPPAPDTAPKESEDRVRREQTSSLRSIAELIGYSTS